MIVKNKTMKNLDFTFSLMNDPEQKEWAAHVQNCKSCSLDLDLIQSVLHEWKRTGENVCVNQDLNTRTLDDMREAFELGRNKKPNRFLLFRWEFAAAVIVLLAIFITPGMISKKTILTTTGLIHIGNTDYKGSKILKEKADITVPEQSGVLIERKGDFAFHLNSSAKFKYEALTSTKLALSLEDGSAEFKIKKAFGKIHITTVNAVIEVTGTCFNLMVDPIKQETAIDLKEGTINVWNMDHPDQRLTMQAGQKTVIRGLKRPDPSGPKLVSDPVKNINNPQEMSHSTIASQEKIYIRDRHYHHKK